MSNITISEAPAENKMGVMPVNRLLFSMSLPMILSMLVQALYNIVDSIFVAQIGETALAAVSLAFPVQNLIIAVSVGTGVGVNALLSRSLGEKNQETANLAAVNGIFVFFLSYLLFAVFGLFFARMYFSVQTSNPEIIEQDGEQTGYEGCLSVPGKTGVVTRPNHVVVRALDENMDEIEVEGEGLLARAICHECAHLDGQLYTELVEGELMDTENDEEEITEE